MNSINNMESFELINKFNYNEIEDDIYKFLLDNNFIIE
jgi:hypothetical protein